MARGILSLCVVLVLAPAFCSEPPDVEEARVYECGVASVYGVLEGHGVPVSIDAVRGRISELFPGVRLDRLSLLQLRRTIESYGLHALSIEADLRRPSAIPTPAILYLRPNRVGNDDIGHVVILKSIDDEQAVIVDFTARIGARRISVEHLKKNWDRELLLVSKKPIRRGDHPVKTAAVVALIGSAVALGWWWRRQRRIASG